MQNLLITWPELTPARLIRRYKRFLADVRMTDGSTLTVHCPNSGRMTGCGAPGQEIYLSRSGNPARKYAYTWEMTRNPESLVVINTLRANQAVKAALLQDLIPELSGFKDLRTEVNYGKNSRIDILLDGNCLVEVKSCTLAENGLAMFPDAPTARGRKHIRELEDQLAMGKRAVLFFLIQRSDTNTFAPAAQIDPKYAADLHSASKTGLEILAYDTRIDLQGIRLGQKIPVMPNAAR